MQRFTAIARTLGAASLAFTLGASALQAQSIWDTDARVGPQFTRYTIAGSTGQTISEFTLPLFAVIPVSPTLRFDIGTSYTTARVSTASGPNQGASQISGFTDTQLRGTYTFGNDFVVLTGGLDLPTGRETVTSPEVIAAARIGSDFLEFPITSMGTGFGGTAGAAVARPFGDWNVGFAASMRVSSAYDPYQDPTGARLHFQPGDEYRARFGADHPLGTGRITLGFTYATFGNDVAGGSIYNTGDRYISEATLTNSYRGADVTIAAWNLHRTSGTLADGTPIGFDNVANALVTLGFNRGGVLLEPTLEVRNWQRDAYLPSTFATLGFRSDVVAHGLEFSPDVGYTVGRLAGPDSSGTNITTAALTGFRLAVAVRW